ncbi:hypothetical protein M422DRAFT_53141 [Sphaerobolus stellatus SS14]|uniref:Uncharacterized protein n=1 Tax=Sphaerobolus stellatus (strain SS14) TaxID=990650 RepID=A0A0C9TPN2_SPHS4|nr:hypothetical protein M422DRAFT_53141 [Sphaerobolus stellatus SS14]
MAINDNKLLALFNVEYEEGDDDVNNSKDKATDIANEGREEVDDADIATLDEETSIRMIDVDSAKEEVWVGHKACLKICSSLLPDNLPDQCLILQQLKRLCSHVFHSPVYCESLVAVQLEANPNKPAKNVVLYIETQWNSFTNEISHGIELQPYLDSLCKTLKFNKKGNCLDKWQLTDDEWDFLHLIYDQLDVSGFLLSWSLANIIP